MLSTHIVSQNHIILLYYSLLSGQIKTSGMHNSSNSKARVMKISQNL